MDTTSILSTFAATSFALLNPLGMLPIFMGYSSNLDVGVQRWLALLVSLTVMGLTLLFLVTGNAIIDFFGITLDSFRVAGGILLLLIGINIVTGDAGKAAKDLVIEAQSSELGAAKSVYRQIVVPFAMPLLVGPGVIANLILYGSEAEARHDPALSLGLIAVTVGIALVTLLILVSGRVLRRLLGDVGLSILTRILGLLVASIGMQFVITGLTNVIVQTIAPAVLKLH
jgi:MarC family membrane protein